MRGHGLHPEMLHFTLTLVMHISHHLYSGTEVNPCPKPCIIHPHYFSIIRHHELLKASLVIYHMK